MYLAFIGTHKDPLFALRHSFQKNGHFGFEDLYIIGPDPAEMICYAGGNGFYLDPEMEAAIEKKLPDYDPDELEDIFWPWLKPDIGRAVETFRHRGRSTFIRLTRPEKERLHKSVHWFDKRRAHFLKIGSMDQGRVDQIPASLFKHLANISRDEIEQRFMMQETALKAKELKSYVYTIFDLQRFFNSFMAKKMPHVLDQAKVEKNLIDELCLLNRQIFDLDGMLHPYLRRYAIMFFDYEYANSTLLDDFANAFMNSRRKQRQPRPRESVTTDKALKIFNLQPSDLKGLTIKALTRAYRQLATQYHPDTGGSHEKFVELNGAYQTILEQLKQFRQKSN